jgi:uncharacterized protein (TIGR02118 family)
LEEAIMVKLTLLYNHPKDPAAFEKYYAQTHMPLAKQVQGVQRMELAKVTGSPDGKPPAYYRTADIYFDDAARLQQVMASPAMQKAVGDLPNFATGGVTVLVADVQ